VTQEPRFLRFADVEFDVKAGELRRGGMTTRLEPQPARVLAMLVDRAGDVVTRAELQQHVWSGDTFVDFERGLNYCIAQIRTALGDSASSPRFIETLPRRGYRFIAPVEGPLASGDQAPSGHETAADAEAAGSLARVGPAISLPTLSADGEGSIGESEATSGEDGETGGSRGSRASGTTAPPSRSTVAGLARTIGIWVLVIAGIVAAWTFVGRQQPAGGAPGATDASKALPAATRPVRIAVALFDNDTKRQDYDQLAQTLTDAIVARLASDTSRLTVIGNSPILRQVRSFRDVTAIGAKLDTEHVILGQVQEIAGRLRVTAHLIRAADEGHVWARRFEPSESDMPTLDRTVADAVANAVTAKLLGQ
jgi:DNA-binding winged helix-turn-helix (wHTH) protein/TolB-like protein